MSVVAYRTELERVIARHQAITNDHTGREIPPEKRAEQERLHARGMELKALIDQAKARDTEAADIAALTEFLEKPANRVPLGGSFNGERDDVAKLVAAGWEQRGSVMFAPTSAGPVPMYPREVLFGRLPEDANAARYVKQTRAAMQPEYAAAFDKWLLATVRSRSEIQGLMQLTSQEQAALLEGQDTAGGYLVPVQTQAEILARKAQRAIMRQFARTALTSRDKLSWPRVQEHATSGSIYSSAFVGDWVGETPAFTETDPKFGLFDIPIKKARAATKLSNDLVSDSIADVLAFLATDGAQNLALVEDKGFIDGDGTALQPKGILRSGASETDVSGTTADTISNTTADAGSAPKLIDLAYALPSQYVEDARWIFRRSIEGKIRKLVNGQGAYHWPDSGFGATPNELMGKPKHNSDFMPDQGTDGNRVAVFGDLSSYVIAQRTHVTVVVLRERFADTDQTGFVLIERVGGDTYNVDGIRIGKV